jgi:hypothetical protein
MSDLWPLLTGEPLNGDTVVLRQLRPVVQFQSIAPIWNRPRTPSSVYATPGAAARCR